MGRRSDGVHPIVLHFALGIVLLSFFFSADLTDGFGLTLTGAVFLPFYAIWLARKLGPDCWRALWVAGPFVLPVYSSWVADYVKIGFGLGAGLYVLFGLIMLAARRNSMGILIIPETRPSITDSLIAAVVLVAAAMSIGIGLYGDYTSTSIGSGAPVAVPVAVLGLVLWGKARSITITAILLAIILLMMLANAVFPETNFIGFDHNFGFGNYETIRLWIGWGFMVPWACGLGIAAAWIAPFVLKNLNRLQKPARIAPIALLVLAVFALPAVIAHATQSLSPMVEDAVKDWPSAASTSDGPDAPAAAEDRDDIVIVTASRTFRRTAPEMIVGPLWLILFGGLAYGVGRRAPMSAPGWMPSISALLAMSIWLTAWLMEDGYVDVYIDELDMVIFDLFVTNFAPLTAIILAAWLGSWLGAHDANRLRTEDVST